MPQDDISGGSGLWGAPAEGALSIGGGGGGGRESGEVAGREQEAGGRWVRHDQSTSAARSSGSAGAGVKTGNACTPPEKFGEPGWDTSC